MCVWREAAHAQTSATDFSLQCPMIVMFVSERSNKSDQGTPCRAFAACAVGFLMGVSGAGVFGDGAQGRDG